MPPFYTFTHIFILFLFLRYIISHQYVKQLNALKPLPSHYLALYCIALHYIALLCIILHCIMSYYDIIWSQYCYNSYSYWVRVVPALSQVCSMYYEVRIYYCCVYFSLRLHVRFVMTYCSLLAFSSIALLSGYPHSNSLSSFSVDVKWQEVLMCFGNLENSVLCLIMNQMGFKMSPFTMELLQAFQFLGGINLRTRKILCSVS